MTNYFIQFCPALEPSGVNVVGGRVAGVGVAGLTLGGGNHLRCLALVC